LIKTHKTDKYIHCNTAFQYIRE